MFRIKSACDGGKEKQKTTRATLGVKKEIIAEHENGVCVSDLASKYGMPISTISMFLMNKEMIKAVNVTKGSKVISRQRPQIIEDVEKSLFVFINEKQLKEDSLGEAFICENALDIYGDLVKKILGANSKDLTSKQAEDASKSFLNEVQFTMYYSQSTNR